MYQCKRCGAGLRYDIKRESLRCDSCGWMVLPEDVDVEADAEEDTFMDVTVFRCPQCGGEVYSDDQTAAGFCSFCGESVILDSRLEKAKRPRYIIPFKVSKDYCIAQFNYRLMKNIYAPDELKDINKNHNFRAIYMPYWVYDFTQEGKLKFSIAKKNNASKYNDYKTVYANLEGEYKGISHDASSTFPDPVSERIGPYTTANRGGEVSMLKKFYPSYLCGFYADVADIGADNYRAYESEYCKDITLTLVKNSINTTATRVVEPEANMLRQIQSTCVCTDMCMFPVWFLAVKRHKRVAYAAVNGQTGKLIADIPISIKRFAMYSALLTLPLFLLFYIIPLTPYRFMTYVASFLVVYMTHLYHKELKRLVDRDLLADDIGRRMKNDRSIMKVFKHSSRREGRVKQRVFSEVGTFSNGSSMPISEEGISGILGFIIGIFYLIVSGIQSFGFSGVDTKSLRDGGRTMVFVAVGLLILCEIYLVIITFLKTIKIKSGNKRFGFLVGFVTVIGAGFTILRNSANDSDFAGSVVICCIGIAFMIIDIVSNHNYFSTLPSPQFKRRK